MQALLLTTVGTILLALAAIWLWKFLRKRPTPEELERVRRLDINTKGKLGDCEITDVENGVIAFTYLVAGVSYTAAQDATTLQHLLPADGLSVLGPASLKYDPRNPANSIVFCEEWSGFRRAR